MKYQDEIDNVNKKLTDIQKATVDYLYKKMYEQGQFRMLVADDVGLGKTWVAKGLVAKAYEYQSNQDKPLNVYYICSNQQLAAQNLKQLNFTKDSNCIVSDVNRISLLALEQVNHNTPIQIFSLTPSTSFSSHSSQGIKKERYIIYKILSECKEFDNKLTRNLFNLLKGSDRSISWKKSEFNDTIRKDVKEKYIDVSCILIDEAQFLTPKQVDDCMKVVLTLDIPVICYGLRTDFMTQLFPGSARLLAIAHT